MNLLWRELIQIEEGASLCLSLSTFIRSLLLGAHIKNKSCAQERRGTTFNLGFVLSCIDAERVRLSQTTTQQPWYQRGALESQQQMHNLMNTAWTLLAVNPAPPLFNIEHLIRVLQFSHKGCDITLKLCFEYPYSMLGTKGFNGNYNLFQKDVWLT